MPKDFAGNTFRNASPLLPGFRVKDWVGKSDRNDYYKVAIGTRSSFSLTVNSKKAFAQVKLINPAGQIVNTAIRLGKKSQVIRNILEAGTYYIHVASRAAERRAMTPYTLQAVATPIGKAPGTSRNPRPLINPFLDSDLLSDLSSELSSPETSKPSPNFQPFVNPIKPVSDPGLSSFAAYNLGELNGKKAFQDSIDEGDKADFYRFTFNQISDFAASASGLSDDIDFNLYCDRNENGLIDSSELVDSDLFGGADRAASIQKTLGAGTYYIAVESAYGNTTPYTLSLSSSPVAGINPVDPGTTPATAYPLGVLNTPVSAKDFVGAVDSVDYYAFSLDRDRDVSATVSGLTSSIEVNLIHDINRNGILDASDQFLKTSSNLSSDSATIRDMLVAGDYFIRVQPRNRWSARQDSNTAYTLTIG